MEVPMVESVPDQQLVERACAGDRAAVEVLFQRHEEPLRAWLRSRIGPGLRHKLDLDDALQETVANALESIESFEFRGDGSFFRWLSTVAERVVLKAAERVRKKPLLTLRHDVAAQQDSPSRPARREERFDRLKKAIQTLSADQRDVVLLARIEGLPIQEIARRMGRSPGAVSMLLARALKNLKESFGDTETLGLPNRSLTPNGPKDRGDVDA